MCVDIDVASDSEETDTVNGASHENGVMSNVEEVLQSEIRYAREKGDGTVKWLELEELNIDDDMLLSLNLSSEFPVCHLIILISARVYIYMYKVFFHIHTNHLGRMLIVYC